MVGFDALLASQLTEKLPACATTAIRTGLSSTPRPALPLLPPVRRYHAHLPHRGASPVAGSRLGYRLVRGALDEVRRLNLKVVLECWFVREVIERNAEFQDLL